MTVAEGRVVRSLRRTSGPSEGEQALIDWALPRGYSVHLDRWEPLEDDEQQEPFDTCDLMAERMMPDGRIFAQWIDMTPSSSRPCYPEMFEHMAELLEAALERGIAEAMADTPAA